MNIIKNYIKNLDIVEKLLYYVVFIIVIIGLLDLVDFDKKIISYLTSFSILFPYHVVAYDLPFWSIFESVFLFLTVLVGLTALLQTREALNAEENRLSKQLAIEQTPYVVLAKGIDRHWDSANADELIVKNIGRGFARNITVSSDQNSKTPFFDSSSPHSQDLATNDISSSWIIWKDYVEKIKKDKDGYFFIYLNYQDQLDNTYRTRVQLQSTDNQYKLMENIDITESETKKVD